MPGAAPGPPWRPAGAAGPVSLRGPRPGAGFLLAGSEVPGRVGRGGPVNLPVRRAAPGPPGRPAGAAGPVSLRGPAPVCRVPPRRLAGPRRRPDGAGRGSAQVRDVRRFGDRAGAPAAQEGPPAPRPALPPVDPDTPDL